MVESELLFTEILDCDRVSLYLNKNVPLGKDNSDLIASVLKRRINGEPIQYILGKTEFAGLEFKVDKNVFIPRPETEILVEAAVKTGRSLSVTGERLKILDLGTGSGCIAVSLAKLLPDAQVAATDISPEAIEVAKENARFHRVKINFFQGGLFNAYHLSPITYHLIISNPPYIPTAEIDKLAPEVKYEPRIALTGGADGMDFYRNIISRAPARLREGGFLILEMGFGQRQAIENIFKISGNFEIIEVIRDYSDIDRVIAAKKVGTDG